LFDGFTAFQIWLIIAAVFAAGIYVGRISADASPASRAHLKRLAREEAARNFAGLSRDTQAEIDRLATQGKIIDAVKLVRKALNTGLYEAKQIVDQRRRPAAHR
jgi:ribosomal protein L7/L12